jgi:holo-[acyl-carrier protein] synthase
MVRETRGQATSAYAQGQGGTEELKPGVITSKVLVGIDVQSIEEVELSMREYGSRYTDRIFTEHELASCGGSPSAAASGLAARFAAKEAMMKILDPDGLAPGWKNIEVQRTRTGRPEIVLWGDAELLARRRGVQEISLSLSHSGGVAVAAVVAQTSADGGDMR